ncbi:calcium-binding protein [Myxosarcina sp. GI1]|uniref:calcium-binding protein n=1 Tax=Myxosarcina sp. GI1 TaxID=1541065 RepID=UPI00068B46C6|nr:calcium-binding protein [Myxosarcina sp. GI1]
MSQIQGTTNNDILLETLLDDFIIALEGNDEIYAGTGRDFVDGGTGFDSLILNYSQFDRGMNLFLDDYDREFYATARETVKSYGMVSFYDIEFFKLLAGSGSDYIYFGYDNTTDEYIDAGAGDDIIDAGLGNDTIDGGQGYDELHLDFRLSPSGVTSSLDSNTSGVYQDGTNKIVFSNIETFEVFGSSYNDRLIGNNNTYINGREGFDTIVLDYSDRTSNIDFTLYTYDFGSETLSGELSLAFSENDFYSYGTYETINFDDIERFELKSGSGDDYLDSAYTENTTDDVIAAGAGDDMIRTGRGIDIVDGGLGFDVLQLDYGFSESGVYTTLLGDKIIYKDGVNKVTFSNIEHLDLAGTDFDDEFYVTDSAFIYGNGGVDTVKFSRTLAEAGNVYLDGYKVRVGNDTTLIGVEFIEFSDARLEVTETGVVNTAERNQTEAQAVIEYGQLDWVGHQLQTVVLNNSFTNPVVFLKPLGTDDTDPAAIRLQNVTSNSFDLQVKEANYLDGIHYSGGVSYFVVEAGTWELPDGTLLEAGTLDSENQISKNWETVNFDRRFDATPAVFTQVQTNNSPEFVRTRQNNVGVGGFQMGMEEEEALENTAHSAEQLGWMAIETGSGNWLGNNYHIGTTGDRITDNWGTVNFTSDFSSAPQFLASLSSYDGPDPAGVRYRNLATNSIELKIEEDTSYDSETSHTTENVSFMALEGEGVITGEALATDVVPQVFGETGGIEFTGNSLTVELMNSYDNPVVFLQPMFADSRESVAMRLNNITGNSFEVRLQQPDYLASAGNLPTFEGEIDYFVMEAGTWQLENGTLLEVGTTSSKGLVEKGVGFDAVDFSAEFATTPMILSQVQTENDPDFVRTRQRNSSTNGFEVALEAEEIKRGMAHDTETVGWLAMETGWGQWGDFTYYANRTEDAVTHDTYAVEFDGLFAGQPQFTANISTYDGSDAAGLYCDRISSVGVELQVLEEQSLDSEIHHTTEIVDFLAIEGSGSLSAIPVADLGF